MIDKYLVHAKLYDNVLHYFLLTVLPALSQKQMLSES